MGKCTHGQRDVNAMDPHERARYESAMKHVEWAKEQGKSSEEIHELFNQIMNRKWDDPVPNDEAHREYADRVERAKAAKAAGAGCREIAAILHGEDQEN